MHIKSRNFGGIDISVLSTPFFFWGGTCPPSPRNRRPWLGNKLLPFSLPSWYRDTSAYEGYLCPRNPLTPSQFWNYTPTIKGHGTSEGCPLPLALTEATSYLPRRGRLEDLECRTTILPPTPPGGAYSVPQSP